MLDRALSKGADLRQMRGIIMYLAHDGIHFKRAGRDMLVYSYPSMERDIDHALQELSE